MAVGDLAEYNCFPGYKMKGSKHLKCTDSGEWNQAKPECECKYLQSLAAIGIVLAQVEDVILRIWPPHLEAS